jgi:serine/threonine protein kinase
MSSRPRAPDSDVSSLEGIPASGTVLRSKYELGAVLGVGGMGVVVSAHHIHLGQRVAIKFMRSIAADDRAAVARFLREARASVSLSSEHVAKVIDVDTLESGAPFIVMEYLAGIDLGETLARVGQMAIDEAVSSILWAPRSEELAGRIDNDALPSMATFRNVSVRA